MTKTVWLWVAALLVPSFIEGALPASADDVILTNGQKLEGVVREEGDQIIVEVPGGFVTVERNRVKSIHRPSEKQSDEYDRRLQGLNGEGASGYYDLALWARQQGMEARTHALLRRAVEIDPDHEGARRALGYRPYKGAWLTEEQYFTAALGLVRYQGEWVPAETASELRKTAHDLQVAQIEQAKELRKADLEYQVNQNRAMSERSIVNYAREERLLNRLTSVELPWGMRYWGPAAAKSE